LLGLARAERWTRLRSAKVRWNGAKVAENQCTRCKGSSERRLEDHAWGFLACFALSPGLRRCRRGAAPSRRQGQRPGQPEGLGKSSSGVLGSVSPRE